MQIVREIRLPVSVVVNGSHRSPPLTVDRKGSNRAWPRSHKYYFQSVAVTRVWSVSMVSARRPIQLRNLPFQRGRIYWTLIRDGASILFYQWLNNMWVPVLCRLLHIRLWTAKTGEKKKKLWCQPQIDWSNMLNGRSADPHLMWLKRKISH